MIGMLRRREDVLERYVGWGCSGCSVFDLNRQWQVFSFLYNTSECFPSPLKIFGSCGCSLKLLFLLRSSMREALTMGTV